MAGSRLILQERDRRILSELARLGVIDRAQAQVIGPFHSVPRANARLLALVRAGLLKREFAGADRFGRKAIYRLPGRRRSGKRRFLAHELATNDIYLELAYRTPALTRWEKPERPLPGLGLIPDAAFELESPAGPIRIYLEVDRGTEPLSVWKQKAQGYITAAAVSGQRRFRVAVVAHSRRRARGIAGALALLTRKIFWLSDSTTIIQQGFLSPHWLRPGGGEPQAFICDTAAPVTNYQSDTRASAQPAGEATT